MSRRRKIAIPPATKPAAWVTIGTKKTKPQTRQTIEAERTCEGAASPANPGGASGGVAGGGWLDSVGGAKATAGRGCDAEAVVKGGGGGRTSAPQFAHLPEAPSATSTTCRHARQVRLAMLESLPRGIIRDHR